MQRTKSGAQYVQRQQEKSTAIIVAIIIEVDFSCHLRTYWAPLLVRSIFCNFAGLFEPFCPKDLQNRIVIPKTARAKAHGQKQIINLYSTKLSTNINKM